MEALEALLTRRSVRAYEGRMPEQDLIDKVMGLVFTLQAERICRLLSSSK